MTWPQAVSNAVYSLSVAVGFASFFFACAWALRGLFGSGMEFETTKTEISAPPPERDR